MTLGPKGSETTGRCDEPGTWSLSRPVLVRIGVITLLLGLTIGWFNLFPRYERSGDQLLRNGDFAQALDGWTVQGPIEAISVTDGTVTLALDDPRRRLQLSQVVTPGRGQRTLGLSVEVATEGVRAGAKAWQTARVVFLGTTPEGKFRWEGHITPVMVSGDNPWHRYSGTFVLPEGVQEAIVILGLARATGIMRIRDVSVFPVREVAAFRYGELALLAGWVIAAALVAVPLVLGVRTRTARILVAVIVLAILIGTLIPRSVKTRIFLPVQEMLETELALLSSPTPEISRILDMSIRNLDAYGHVILFFAVAMAFRIFRPGDRMVTQFGYLLLFAAVSETLQYFTPTRQPGLYDWLSDGIGITLAFVLYGAVALCFGKQRHGAAPPHA